MKKYILFLFIASLTITAFAFTSNSSIKEDNKIKEYDRKIESLEREIQELNKNEQHKTAILDNLLNTI